MDRHVPERPDLLVDATGKTVAVRGLDGRLALMGDRPTAVLARRFAGEQWLAAEGDRAALAAPEPHGWPRRFAIGWAARCR